MINSKFRQRSNLLGIATFTGLSLFASTTVISAKSITPIVVDLLLSDSNPTTPPPNGPEFGAQRVNEANRPTRDWLSVFSGVTPVPLAGSLQDAIDDCPNNSNCVIEIDQLSLSETVFINRSNIKLIGKIDNKIEFTGTGTVLYVESGTTNLVFENLNIDGRINGASIERDPDVYGIYLNGETIQNILIKDNHIQHLDGKEGAHGIAALGTGNSEASAISNLIIEGNQLNDLRTGFSESIVVNGNVKQWEIIDNDVLRVNNIAIDAIGGEGTSPTQVVNGRTLPGPFDAARFGFIQNNRVTTMSTLTNAAYGSQHSFAAGIYIDGGRDIVVSDNVITDTPWAFEIGSENCLSTSNITLENNESSLSRFGDLLIGGYADDGYLVDLSINCNPATSQDRDEGHGYVRLTTVKSNSFNSTGVLDNVIELSNRIRNTVIIQTGVNAVNTDGNANGDQNSIRTSE